MSLFAPLTPYEIERRERERIARKRPDLALVSKPDPRPDPDMFRWWSPAELIAAAQRTENRSAKS